MSPFGRKQTTSYSPLTETMHPFCRAYRFRYTSYLSKGADFKQGLTLHLVFPWGVILFECHQDLCRQKTAVFEISSCFVCVILRSAVLTQYRLVTDTHGQTKAQSS